MLIAADARETVLHLLPRAGKGMEIGVWRGAFTSRILKIANPQVLHLVDPWHRVEAAAYQDAWYGGENSTEEELEQIFEGVRERFSRQIALNRVVIHRSLSQDALPKFPDGELDFVYIDGDHTFDGVLMDLRNAFRAVRVGGLICGDDYTLGGWWKGGVVRALHEFLPSHSVVLHLVLGSQFVLRKLATAGDTEAVAGYR